MFDRFTTSARYVTTVADRLTRELYHPRVEPSHLLIALFADPDAVAAKVIASFGAAPTSLGDGLLAQLVPGRSEYKGPVPYSRDAKKVMRLAITEAHDPKTPFIGTQHLLLALLRGGSSQTATTFASAGLALDPVRARTLQLTGPDGPALRDPDLTPEERVLQRGLRIKGVAIDPAAKPPSTPI